MRTAEPGDYPMRYIQALLGLSPDGMKKLRRALKDDAVDLAKALADLNVVYVAGSSGRGNPSKLVKLRPSS
jgi:hypothetical protein